MASTLQSHKPIATRFKSLKQKQYTHKQNLKTLTQLLKTPNITIKKSLLNNVKIIDIGQLKKSGPLINHVKNRNDVAGPSKISGKQKKRQPKSRTQPTEYYPSLPKRKVESKKVHLKPRHCYKVIGTTNKRKRRIPHYYTEKSEQVPNTNCFQPRSQPSPTMEELIKLANDDLNDEDLLEILTCPSPVWWEDDEAYGSEDDLKLNYDGDYEEIIQQIENNAQKVYMGNSLFKTNNGSSVMKSYDEFKEKRSKLESILGNIMVKKQKFGENDNSDENSDKNEISDNSGISDKNEIADNDGGKKRKNSIGALSDSSINEDLLNTLENIEIPVKEHCDIDISEMNDDKVMNKITIDKKSNTKQIVPMRKSKRKSPIKIKYEDFNYYNVYPTIRKRRNKPDDEIDNNKNVKKSINYVKTDKNEKRNVKDGKNKIKTDVDTKENLQYDLSEDSELNDVIDLKVPTMLPTLTKHKSNRNTKDGAKNKIVELDSISDTNIKFLDDYDEKCEEKLDDTINSNLITIYRILPTEPEEVDVEDQIIANLLSKDMKAEEYRPEIIQESLTKPCRKKIKKEISHTNKLHRKEKIYSKELPEEKERHFQDVATCKNTRSNVDDTHSVPNTKAKYCHRCSSIFYTDACQYCKKITRKCKK